MKDLLCDMLLSGWCFRFIRSLINSLLVTKMHDNNNKKKNVIACVLHRQSRFYSKCFFACVQGGNPSLPCQKRGQFLLCVFFFCFFLWAWYMCRGRPPDGHLACLSAQRHTYDSWRGRYVYWWNYTWYTPSALVVSFTNQHEEKHIHLHINNPLYLTKTVNSCSFRINKRP